VWGSEFSTKAAKKNRINAILTSTEANAAGSSVRACVARKS